MITSFFASKPQIDQPAANRDFSNTEEQKSDSLLN